MSDITEKQKRKAELQAALLSYEGYKAELDGYVVVLNGFLVQLAKWRTVMNEFSRQNFVDESPKRDPTEVWDEIWRRAWGHPQAEAKKKDHTDTAEWDDIQEAKRRMDREEQRREIDDRLRSQDEEDPDSVEDWLKGPPRNVTEVKLQEPAPFLNCSSITVEDRPITPPGPRLDDAIWEKDKEYQASKKAHNVLVHDVGDLARRARGVLGARVNEEYSVIDASLLEDITHVLEEYADLIEKRAAALPVEHGQNSG